MQPNRISIPATAAPTATPTLNLVVDVIGRSVASGCAAIAVGFGRAVVPLVDAVLVDIVMPLVDTSELHDEVVTAETGDDDGDVASVDDPIGVVDVESCAKLRSELDTLENEVVNDEVVKDELVEDFVIEGDTVEDGMTDDPVDVYCSPTTPTIVCAVPNPGLKVPRPLAQLHRPDCDSGPQHQLLFPQATRPPELFKTGSSSTVSINIYSGLHNNLLRQKFPQAALSHAGLVQVPLIAVPTGTVALITEG